MSHEPVAVTVDLVVLTIRHGRLCVLLVERGADPFRGAWALPGGFVEAGETLDAAAARELVEETALDLPEGDGHLEQLASYGDPGRDPRMRVVSVAYLAMVPDLPAPEAGTDAAAARWWPVEDLDEAGGLAFDHTRILEDGLDRARAKIEYTTLATAFVDEPFTLTELRRVYETVWGTPLHGANFARKVQKTNGFVVPLGELAESTGRGRPAALYRRGDALALVPAMLRPSANGSGGAG